MSEDAGQKPLWEQLVRRAYPAHKLAKLLGRDIKEIQRWCRGGLPHNLGWTVRGVLDQAPEWLFCSFPVLPTGWLRVAVCDGGQCTHRQWLEVRGAGLTLADALLLDRLGYGMVMHRPISSGTNRQFALEFHLLPGRVAGMAV